MKRRVLAAVVVCFVGSACGAWGGLTDGLQSYWNFDGSSSDYQDKVGAVHLQERAGYGANIECVRDYALAIRSLKNNQDTDAWLRSTDPMGTFNIDRELTVSIWVRQTLPSGAGRSARLQRGSTDPENGSDYSMFSMYTSQGYLPGSEDNCMHLLIRGYENGNDTLQYRKVTSLELTSDKWHHIVLRIPSTAVGATVDAGSIDDADMTFHYSTTLWGGAASYGGIVTDHFSPNNLIGGGVGGGADECVAMFDEWAIWNRRLTDQEVEDLHDLGRNGEPLLHDPTIDLQSYWSFDNSASDYRDKIGTVHLQERVGHEANIGCTSNDAVVGRSLRNEGDEGAWLHSTQTMGTFNLDRELTLAAWVRQSLTGPNQRAVVTRGGNDPANSIGDYSLFSLYTKQGYGVAPDDTIFTIMHGIEGVNPTTQQKYVYTTLQADKWHYVVLRIPYSAYGCNMSVGSVDDPDLSVALTWNWWTGGYNGLNTLELSTNYLSVGGIEVVPAMFDEVAIYNRSLTDMEIEYLFDLGKAGTPIKYVPTPPPIGTVVVLR